MIAVASLLDIHANERIHQIWDWLEANCGLSEIKLTPLPHFTWQSAEDYELAEVQPALKKLASELTPFRVRTSGIGIFTGEAPVFYLALIKSRPLLDLHERIWVELASLRSISNPYYSPEIWIPHITLARKDITPDNLACALSGMIHTRLEIDIDVNNFSVIYQIGELDGVRFRIPFLG
jgi:2'-5' RNA ligase